MAKNPHKNEEPDLSCATTNTYSPFAELNELPVFVYGTLRSGGRLHHLLVPHLIEGPHPATTPGHIGVATAGEWPVLIEGDGVVKGELYVLRVTPESMNVLGVEELAWGYSLRWLPFDVPGFTGRAVVCTWEWSDGYTKIVDHGDWLRYLAER